MKRLIKTKVFGVAFFASYIAAVIAAWSVEGWNPSIGVGSTNYGFPFTYYSSHCFGGGYVVPGLLGNAAFGCLIATGFAFAASNMWTKFSSPEFRTKWYL
jgi:hypothetical protein